MNRGRIVALVVCVVFGLGACLGNDADAVRNQLLDAEANWERAEVSSYRIEATEHRNYFSTGCTWFTVVEAGAVVDFGLAPTDGPETCTARSMTVEDLHDTIDRLVRMLISEQGDLAVDWSGEGVPLRIQVDVHGTVDDESDLEIRFRPA